MTWQGYLAQGAPPVEAAAVAAYVHGAAADRLAARMGDAGVLAGDLAAEVPAAMEALRSAAHAWNAADSERGPSGLALPFPGA